MDNKPEQEHLIGYDEFDQAGADLIKKRKTRQRIGMAVIMVIILAVAAVSIFAFFATREESEEYSRDGAGFFGGQGRQNVVTASGTTVIGMDEVTFEIDFLEDTSLYVEEVYLSSSDEVEAGTKVLKLTEDSVAAAREELESTLQSAELSYRSSVITTKESQIQAQYTYQQALLAAEQAQGVYEDALSEQQAELDAVQQAYDAALESYNELYWQIENNTFYDDYEVAEKREAYQEAKEIYTERYSYWEITEDELKQSTTTTNKNSKLSAEEKAILADRNWIIKTIQLLQEEMEETQTACEKAESDYQSAVENAELNIKVLLNELEAAKEDLEKTSITYQKETLSAKTSYETALIKKQTAKNDYDTQITSAEEALDKLRDAMEDAEENLALFEETIGDGFFYTQEAGTLLMIRIRQEEELTGGAMVFAYSKPNEITVSVSVSQDLIAQVAVGDSTSVSIADNGTFEGTVTEINPVSSSSSRNSVTYTVTVSLEGDVTGLEANQTATVIFGADDTMRGGNHE